MLGWGSPAARRRRRRRFGLAKSAIEIHESNSMQSIHNSIARNEFANVKDAQRVRLFPAVRQRCSDCRSVPSVRFGGGTPCFTEFYRVSFFPHKFPRDSFHFRRDVFGLTALYRVYRVFLGCTQFLSALIGSLPGFERMTTKVSGFHLV